MFCFNEFAFIIQVKHKINSTQILGFIFWYVSILCFYFLFFILPSVLWRCWLGGRKGIRPVKNIKSGGVLVWLFVWNEVQTCIMAHLMPLPPTVSCFSKIQIGFTFLVLAHLGCPGQRALKRVCVLFVLLVVVLCCRKTRSQIVHSSHSLECAARCLLPSA